MSVREGYKKDNMPSKFKHEPLCDTGISAILIFFRYTCYKIQSHNFGSNWARAKIPTDSESSC